MADFRAETEGSAEALDVEVVNLHIRNEKKKRASAVDIGIAYHRIMEFLDYNRVCRDDGNVDTEYIRERSEFLHDHDAIEDDVYKALDLEKIAAFFTTEIGRRTLDSARKGKLEREKAFTLKTERLGREILVQGVIDCCFEENGRMILIDYKSSYVKKGAHHDAEIERIRREYKTQIELYKEAIEKGTGLEVGEAHLYLFDTAESVKMQ